jgi:hypothetical protein
MVITSWDFALHYTGLPTQARLKGALRRLDIPTTDEFDEGEYAEATEAVYKAVSGVCSQSR